MPKWQSNLGLYLKVYDVKQSDDSGNINLANIYSANAVLPPFKKKKSHISCLSQWFYFYTVYYTCSLFTICSAHVQSGY